MIHSVLNVSQRNHIYVSLRKCPRKSFSLLHNAILRCPVALEIYASLHTKWPKWGGRGNREEKWSSYQERLLTVKGLALPKPRVISFTLRMALSQHHWLYLNAQYRSVVFRKSLLTSVLGHYSAPFFLLTYLMSQSLLAACSPVSLPTSLQVFPGIPSQINCPPWNPGLWLCLEEPTWSQQATHVV